MIVDTARPFRSPLERYPAPSYFAHPEGIITYYNIFSVRQTVT